MRRLAAALPALATLLLTAAPAAADPVVLPDRPLNVIGSGDVAIRYDAPTDRLEVWLDGDVSKASRTTGTWTLVIAGSRGGVPFTQTWSTDALTVVDHKVYVPRLAPAGEFSVDWAYTGIGGYLVVHMVHQVAWTAPTSNVAAGTGVTQ